MGDIKIFGNVRGMTVDTGGVPTAHCAFAGTALKSMEVYLKKKELRTFFLSETLSPHRL